MDSSRVLRAIDTSSGLMVARGSLSLPDGGGKLFVGNGIAYAAAPQRTGSTGAGGFATANVSNPKSLTLISGADFNFGTAGTAPGAAIAVNGSGLGILVGDNLGQNQLFVMDVANPADTAQRLVQINLPAVSGGAQSVAIASGIGFVADGTGGLRVVNYLPFDNKQGPPTVSISTSATDVDLIQPGLQVLEGFNLTAQANVNDDVQVRNVELLVKGQVVRNDVSFPFDFFAIAPQLAPGVNSFTLQVRATDTGGNVALSNVLSSGHVNDASPTTITSFVPPTNSSQLEPIQTVQIRSSKGMSTATVTADTVRVRDAGGSFLTPTTFQLRDDDRLVQLTFPPLLVGTYQIVVSSTVTDRAGNMLSATDVISPFTLKPRETLTVTNPDADTVIPGL